MEFRMAAAGDIEQLMRSRLDTLRDVNHLDSGYVFSDDFRAACRKYFLGSDHSTVLATDGGRVCGCATMCYMQWMPTFSHPSGKRAHLMNVWTDPSCRRQGIARRMVSLLLEEAWRRGVTEVSLDATEAGRPLYRSLGFHDSGEYMVLEKENI